MERYTPIADEWTPEPEVEVTGEEKKPEKKKKRKGLAALLIVLMLLLSCCLGYAGAAIYSSSHNGSGNNISKSDGYTLEDATGSNQTVSQVAEANADAVVEIVTEAVATDSWYGQYITEGAGSGVIISSDGYIMTNNHVVEGARSVKVTLHNGDDYTAKVVGVDSNNDVAVLKIDAKKLTAATYGNSDQLKVGEMAVAIGNPLGKLGGTVTAGIISATDRTITVDNKEMTLLQTDASINPGNSGGGLFNQDGQLIGLVVAKSSGSDVEGLGFAIPINTAAEVAQQIIDKGGNVESSSGAAYIGVTVSDTNDGVQIVAISSVAAQKSGFQVGDIITKLGDNKIKDSSSLSKALSKFKPGDKTTVEVKREGDKVKLKATLIGEEDFTYQTERNNGDQEMNPFLP